jgi:hypothetical protein
MTAPLLPQDRYIAELLGLSEEEMRWYKAEVQRRALEGPQPAVVNATTAITLAIISLSLTAVSVGLTIISMLLVPRPDTGQRGRLTTRQRQGDTLQVPSAFAPTYGFEAVQDVAPLGDPIPLVYTKREFLNGQWYGGTRVSTPLLWSQIWSLGGNQMLRAVLLVSEGEIGAIHPYSFAIGNNSLGAYSFDGNLQRIAIYSVNDGGRMAIGNYLSGSQNDSGAEGDYANDIFRVDTGINSLATHFCGAYKPSTSTSFGLYSPIANGLGYRINPRIRPLRQLQADGDVYDAVDDAQAVAEAWKYKYCYSSKSGIISTSKGGTSGSIVALSVGDTFEYMLSSKSDAVRNRRKNPSIFVNQRNSDNKTGSMDGEETLVSVAQSVAGRQKQYDSALQEGELYKVGSCLAILVSRSPVFISEADYSLDALEEDAAVEGDPGSPGESAFYIFRVVRAGSVGVVGTELVDTRFFDVPATSKIYPAENGDNPASKPWLYDTEGTNYAAGQIGKRHYTASYFPQLFRCALGGVSLNRRTRYFEIGIRSTVAMQVQGMCNFADVPVFISEFIRGTVTPVTIRDGNTGGLENGTFTRAASGGSGTGLTFSITVSGGFITSTTATVLGTGYAASDRVTVSLNLASGGTQIVTYRISVTSAGAVTPVSITSGNTGGLTNGTFSQSPAGGSGNGLAFSIVVSGGLITSTLITSPGTSYKTADSVTVSLNVAAGGTRTVTYRINAVAAVQTGAPEVPGYRAVNWKAADALDGADVEDNLTNAVFTSGTITSPEKRYSFFRVSLRSDPSNDSGFVTTGNTIFCVANAKETPVFNYLRFAMNGDASWEVRIEPVSSWEIRNENYSIIQLAADSNDYVSVDFPLGSVIAKGEYLVGVSTNELFDIQNLRPKREIGISWTEGNYGSNFNGTYIDLYARAAEFFVYDEITTTCSSGPEHEITYVNVIQPNDSVPQYDNLCLVGINAKASREWSQFSQFSAYITEGIKVNTLLGGYESTHLFPEILYDFMLNKRYGLGNEISPEQIDIASFTAAAQFCLDNRFFYDGPKLNNTNWRQWAADTAATHCLLLIERGGVFYLEQAIPEQPEIRGLFTAGNCISMELSMAEAEQRQPVSISVKYRTEQYGGAAPSESTDPSYGLFPEPQETLVYHTTWGEGVTESIDMSEYCTSKEHAIKTARYIIGARKLSDHTVKISTTHEALTSSLAPGDFIKVALDYTHYNQFVNGAVTGNGSLISSTPLSDGAHTVIYWTGDQGTEVVEGTLTVSNNGTTASPAGIVFTVKTSEILTRTYRIDSIQPSEDGYEIDAVHTPLLTNGMLQLYAEWSDSSYWTEA